MTARPGRPTGRRHGESDTRESILASARELFSRRGLTGTTIRAVAGGAGVDPALVHHYFGTKQDLFLAAAELPVDPEVVRSRIRAVPFPELGRTLCTAVLTIWGSTNGAALLARFRTSVTDGHGGEIGDFLMSAAMPILVDRTLVEGDAPDHAVSERRVTLAMSQLIGVVVARHVLRLPVAREMSVPDLVDSIGPVVQSHLEGASTPQL